MLFSRYRKSKTVTRLKRYLIPSHKTHYQPTTKFLYEDLKAATDNFSNQIDDSGLHSIFKGILQDGSQISVKLFHGERSKMMFEAEISALSSVQHVNIIRLRGYCHHVDETGEYFLVVYDLMINGSLNNCISSGCRFLSWKERYVVAIGVAKALLHLHHDCHPPVSHLDVNPRNILLDDKFEAVLSNFGISVLTEDKSELSFDIPRGAPGYMAPEMVDGERISTKSDVYSYGKLLLYLFFGEEYICLDRDERLKDDSGVDNEEVSLLVCAALLCCEHDPAKRLGDMRQVVKMLEDRNTDGIDELLLKQIELDAFDDKVRDILLEGTSDGIGINIDGSLKRFSYEELQTATKKFNKEYDLGRGEVFKGCLEDETWIVVKQVRRHIHGNEEFLGALSAISKVKHPNIGRLRGYCSRLNGTQRELFIVYDLFEHGSLDSWIFPNSPDGRCLSWSQRCIVAFDVAAALLYLHRDSPQRIVHLDIKPGNILLDDNFRGVIADFGMCKLIGEEESIFHTKIARGSPGYMAPEWNSGYKEELNVDIFSYGRLLLDMFVGQGYVCFDEYGNYSGGNMPFQERTSLTYLKKKIEQKEVLAHIDTRLLADECVNETVAGCFLGVAIKCLEEDPEERPRDMSTVLTMLEPLFSL